MVKFLLPILTLLQSSNVREPISELLAKVDIGLIAMLLFEIYEALPQKLQESSLSLKAFVDGWLIHDDVVDTRESVLGIIRPCPVRHEYVSAVLAVTHRAPNTVHL